MTDTRALTIRQPWASAIAEEHKRIETRSWATKYRGPVLIHAGLNYHAVKYPSLYHDTWAALQNIKFRLTLGCVIAVAELGDCVPISIPPEYDITALDLGNSRWGEVPDKERALGDYTPGRYGWILSNICKLNRPVPATGKQGLWIPSPELVAAVEEQLKGATNEGH